MSQAVPFENGRVVRKAFPDMEMINAVMGGNDEALVQRLTELYGETLAALEEAKKTHSGVKSSLGALIRDVKDDVSQVFTDEEKKGFKQSAKLISRSVLDLLKDSAGEVAKLKDEGADVTFLLGRLVQYRNALLDRVSLRDPIGIQEELHGQAMLVYVDTDGKAWSANTSSSDAVTDAVKDHTPIIINEADVSNEEEFLALVHQFYRGRPGLLKRKNVYLVDAPRGAVLNRKQILNKATGLYRTKCRNAKPGSKQPEEPKTNEEQGA